MIFRSEVHPTQAMAIGLFDNTTVQDNTVKQKDLRQNLISMREKWIEFARPAKVVGGQGTDKEAVDSKARLQKFHEAAAYALEGKPNTNLPSEMEKVRKIQCNIFVLF